MVTFVLVMNRSGNIYGQFAYFRRRSRNTYLTTLGSISLMLFFLGLFATITIFGRSFAGYAREAIVMKIFLHDGIDSVERNRFIDQLSKAPYTRSLRYINKEEAQDIMFARTGEDVLKLTDGVNPFLASLDIQLNDLYINLDSLRPIRTKLEQELLVAEVSYPAEMINIVSKRMNMIGFVFLLTGAILVAIVLYLIFSTIRLSIYAQRLIIRSMQLIGATNAFIRRPFVINGFLQGLLSGVIASVLLIGSMYFVRQYLIEMGLDEQVQPNLEFIGILVGIVLFGTILGFSGSFLAVNRYLNKNLDELM